MALALTILNGPDGGDNTQRRTIIEGTAVLSGSYTAGGETPNWTNSKTANGQEVLINSLRPTAPLWVEMNMSSASGTTPILIPVTYNYTTGKFQVWVASTGVELAAGAYTASYTGATFRFQAEFANEA